MCSRPTFSLEADDSGNYRALGSIDVQADEHKRGPAKDLHNKSKLRQQVNEAALDWAARKGIFRTAMASLVFAIHGGKFHQCSRCKLYIALSEKEDHVLSNCAAIPIICPEVNRKYVCVFGDAKYKFKH